MRELMTLSLAHASGRYARKPRWLRWLAVPYSVLNLPTTAAYIARGELFVSGTGTSVVMTGQQSRRMPLGVLLLTVLGTLVFAVAVPALFAVGAFLAPPLPGLLLRIAFFAVYLVAVASCVVLVFPLARPRDEKAAIARLGGERPIVRLHDLARAPRDDKGAGVRLLGDIIRDPRFAGTTIVATAAHETLARRYEAAGMSRFQPDSLTVYRNA